MAGTTGLEPATSAVTGLPYYVFQQLTSPWWTAEVLVSRVRQHQLWVGLWVEELARESGATLRLR